MNESDISALQQRYVEMSSEEFGELRRENLIEEAQACYDREVERRNTPEWKAAELKRVEEYQRHERAAQEYRAVPQKATRAIMNETEHQSWYGDVVRMTQAQGAEDGRADEIADAVRWGEVWERVSENDRQSLEEFYRAKSTDELLADHSAGILTSLAYEVLEAELTTREVPVPQRSPSYKKRLKKARRHWCLMLSIVFVVGYLSFRPGPQDLTPTERETPYSASQDGAEPSTD